MKRAEIEQLLPHRDPFLLIDEIVEIVPGESATAFKDVRDTEFWVPGHFPNEAVMPGVLIAEAMAQVAGVIYVLANQDKAGNALYLVGMDKIRFRRPVRPGDRLMLQVSVEECRRRMWRFKATALVNGKKVADGSLLATASA